MGPLSLRAVGTADLLRLAGVLEARQSVQPLTLAELSASGLSVAVRAVPEIAVLAPTVLRFSVQAVLSERDATVEAHLQLVWTGPESLASRARDTGVVVDQLFREAKKSALVAGFRFDNADRILAPLHDAMAVRGVKAELFIDVEHPNDDVGPVFLSRNWPFGPPVPTIFARSDGAAHASMHAKCVVIDEERTLITSANFTSRGQDRNIEVGVLIADKGFAHLLVDHWRATVSAGYFCSV